MKNFVSLSLLFSTTFVLAACTSSPTENMNTQSSSSTSASEIALLTGMQKVTITTSKGDIKLELDASTAPKTVTNFVTLAQTGYYNDLTFHRVIPGFMIQGGDPNGNGTGGKSIYGDTFEDEINPSSPVYQRGYKTGVIAMANRGPNTNGSQFFIMDTDYPLPPNYTIFGNVTEGIDVVHAIASVPRDQNDMPNEKVTFSVKVSN